MMSKSKGFDQHLLENCCSVAEYVEKLVLQIVGYFILYNFNNKTIMPQ